MKSCCPDLEQAPQPSDMTLLRRLAAVLAGHLPGCGRLCVALSGGRDSVVLLHALSRLRAEFFFGLSAVHVHHGLSAQADAWAGFCTALCQRLDVPLTVARVDVARDSGEGLEAAARRRRYAVFAAIDADALLLAHHRDDQAETVLLNLLRGAGVAGSAAMPQWRRPAQGPALWRPLLDVPRVLLERYAQDEALSWIDDESNADVHYRRNFLRHQVLPSLEEKFPAARGALARAADHFAECAALLDELAALDGAALADGRGHLQLAPFNALSPARARNVLRHAWREAGFRAPPTGWIDEALKQLATADGGTETCLETAEGQLQVYRGALYIGPHQPAPPGRRVWCGEGELPWAGGCVRFLSVTGAGIGRRWLENGEIVLMPRQGGECLRLAANRPRRSLRNLLQEAAIPPWQRLRLPLLWCAGRLAWVGGLGVDTALACAPDEEGVLPVWEAP